MENWAPKIMRQNRKVDKDYPTINYSPLHAPAPRVCQDPPTNYSEVYMMLSEGHFKTKMHY